MSQYVWLVPVFPLIGFLINGLFNRNLSKSISGIIGSGSVLASFIVSLGIFFEQVANPELSVTVKLLDWINLGGIHANFSFLVDSLSSLYILFITGIGFFIHLYSTGYMHDDDGFRRYFAYLNLFVFFMLLLVLGDSFLMMFVGWEGVGLCSYLLIGFWFKNTDYNNAAKKAFIMNRIGDLGFLLGMILIYMAFGALDYATVFQKIASNTPTITLITLLLFIGAMGKSAQIPLYTWLPDAMAGPTPVSALIHAATMVTAGIYMIARSNALFAQAPDTLNIIATIGLLTAIVAATIGLYQNDIKKVLAYSTVSQLGLMFLGLGFGAYTASVFHVTTHAFFKALLFLGAGSVIHAMSGEQDIRNMGGLKKYLPITYWTFFIACLAISGIFPFAGFFSKDEILVHVFEHNKIYGWLALIASYMTAFYMFRLFFLTFSGKFRGTEEQHHHLHESPWSMTIPLIVLAIMSAISGFIGIPELEGITEGPGFIERFLHPVFGGTEIPVEMPTNTKVFYMMIALLGSLIVILVARYFYINKETRPVAEGEHSGIPKLIYNKYYVDEIYNSVITKPLDAISNIFYNIFDKKGIDGVVNGLGSGILGSGSILRRLQTGNVGFYISAIVISIILMLLFKIF